MYICICQSNHSAIFYNTLYTHTKRANRSFIQHSLSSIEPIQPVVYQTEMVEIIFKSCFVPSSLVHRVVGQNLCAVRKLECIRLHKGRNTREKGSRQDFSLSFPSPPPPPSTLPFIFLGTFYTFVSSLTLLPSHSSK